MSEVTEVSTICVVGILRWGIKTSLSKFLWIPYNDWSIPIFLVDFMVYYATFLRNHLVCLERIIILDLYWESKIDFEGQVWQAYRCETAGHIRVSR